MFHHRCVTAIRMMLTFTLIICMENSKSHPMITDAAIAATDIATRSAIYFTSLRVPWTTIEIGSQALILIHSYSHSCDSLAHPLSLSLALLHSFCKLNRGNWINEWYASIAYNFNQKHWTLLLPLLLRVFHSHILTCLYPQFVCSWLFYSFVPTFPI